MDQPGNLQLKDEKRSGAGPRMLIMAVLIFCGEVVFLLPFVTARIFRPTFLDVFGVTNFQLGTAFSAYGIVAMVSYFAGGPLADRFSARRLITLALVCTALAGFVMSAIPSLAVLTILYAFFGLSTVLLFWAPLIRTTRLWGGKEKQGLAYGLLDSGRGLVSALIASFSVVVFALLLPGLVEESTLSERREALQVVFRLFSGITLLAALLVWLVIPEAKGVRERISPRKVISLLRKPAIWLHAVIVLCAYVAFKGTDNFSLYARDAFGYDDVQAATIGTISFWMRPVAALLAGLLADKFSSSQVLLVSFLGVITGTLMMSLGFLHGAVYATILSTIALTSLGIYALRGVYFALLQEGRTPLELTGTAVGIVSMIGFTPDIFMGPLMGYLIDRSPGHQGHQHVFLVIMVFSIVGLVATILFRRLIPK